MMKKTVYLKIMGLFAATLVPVLCWTVLTYAEHTQNAEALDRFAQVKGKDHFTPVRCSERKMASQLNEYRRSSGLPALRPDWDLFRLARMSAEDMASGQISAVKKSDIGRRLNHLGYRNRRVSVVTVRSSLSDKSVPAVWQESPHAQQLIKQKDLQLIGVGHSVNNHEQVWVILLSTDQG
ncbi:CAP domain-containing protein [Sporolactobacillus sp. THM7-4]|nr:CAP domain-containing protein [Sporolactobacillus sp. THM7-4]